MIILCEATNYRLESVAILKNYSSLYSFQTDPNKPVHIAETKMESFIEVLIMICIDAFVWVLYKDYP